MARAILLGCIAVSLIAGVSCGRQPSNSESRDGGAGGKPLQERSPGRQLEAAADFRTAVVRRLEPPGSSAPQSICGHAVAFAGWRPGNVGADVLLIHDPADNGESQSGSGDPIHSWKPKPLLLPVRYGERRPGVTLLPAASYSIAGAVVVASTGAAGRPRSGPVLAAAMPDLSQNFPGRGPGLCGPTSAADILYSIAPTRSAVLDGVGRVPAANEDVAALVLGGDGLAELMAIHAEDEGATNDGIRAGLEAWLAKADPGAWAVSLEWLEDEPRSQAAQQRFLERLAAAVAGGGGVVLCLWPGHDQAEAGGARDVPVGGASRGSAGAQPAASAGGAGSADGNRAAGDQATAVAEAKKSMEAARRSLERGLNAEAVEAVGRAVAAVRRPAVSDPACRECLNEALGLAAEIDRRAPAGSPIRTTKPTNFE